MSSNHSPPANRSGNEPLESILRRRYPRRGLLKVGAGAAALGVLGGLPGPALADQRPFDFEEVTHGMDETHHLPAGYRGQVLLRWGDPLFPGLPPFDPRRQTAADQLRRFGYNNDYVGFVPLSETQDGTVERGLLCVNHEYVSAHLAFPEVDREARQDPNSARDREVVAIEMAAQGGSIVEIRRDDAGLWQPVLDSRYNRRISALDTEMLLRGPAAGHPRMQTGADRSGRRVLGTFANCAGGITPWGSYLLAEENFHGYFERSLSADHPEAANHERLGIGDPWVTWGRFHKRFDIAQEPREPNRFGWIVDVNPRDPASTPVKRTALGRFAHEGAETVLSGDGRVVVYMGDDARDEYLYRYVSAGRYDPEAPSGNDALLDRGVLSVARFEDDGRLLWLPLVFGAGPLTPKNGFESQAEVLIETRRAADLLGGTPLDRPEDVQPNPATGRVYACLTNNSKRTHADVDAANPRAPNNFGHILELQAPPLAAGFDHGAEVYQWELLVLCGDPDKPEAGARWHQDTSENGWFASPDNAAVDPLGRLWIATDQGRRAAMTGTADGLWALETEGPGRGTGRMFFRAPAGAEVCGPCFAPDGKTLFLAVQHPGAGGRVGVLADLGVSYIISRVSFEHPTTRWPDFDERMPPRPALLAITRVDGGPVGG